MSHRVAGAPLDFAALRNQLEVPGDFASEVLTEAERSAAAPQLPDDDATDIEFVTIDPPGSRDLDQAVHIERLGDGHVVRYAIADVASFVRPGGALDAETHRRGETIYFPDVRVPLHPPVLSEGAASLLPDLVRPAVLWTLRLDAAGELVETNVRRARVRSRAQLDYPGVQRSLDDGSMPPAIAELPVVGERRMALARARHAIDLNLPAQEVVSDGNGNWTLVARDELLVERCNAEISLLTGVAAAALMLAGGHGVLRTVPPADERALHTLRRAAKALDIDWPSDTPPSDLLASLDRTDPRHLAFVEHAAALLRGAAYQVFDGAPPAQPGHAGIGAPYAHVTAPLRRLVDRYGSEICLALTAGTTVPDWVCSALPELPELMRVADRKAHEADRAVVDATEAWLLRDRTGDTFDAVVIDADDKAGTVVLDRPSVRARCAGADLPVGEHIAVRLVTADVDRREVRFERADGPVTSSG